MEEIKKTETVETEQFVPVEEESSFDFRTLLSMFILNWQWFVLSAFICLCAAFIYLRYKAPTYQVSAKMLIKDEVRQRSGSNRQMLANMQEMGFITNSTGIENEVEILHSKILACEAVKDLKLYTEYRKEGRVINSLIYKKQPLNIDLDPATLQLMDKNIMTESTTYNMKLTRKGERYHINGIIKRNGGILQKFSTTFSTLPINFKTKAGVITITQNPEQEWDDEDATYLVSIRPPMAVATSYLNALSVAPTTKMTSIAQLTLRNANPLRGMDFLSQLAICYNRQANADKNEIALKTEEFINERMEKIEKQLGNTEAQLESYKKRHNLTQLRLDATETLSQSNQLSQKLSDANTQIQLLDYLREYVNNPDNRYELIPSNVGLSDQASTQLIVNYNKNVQDRNKMLRAASENAPQVQTLTSTIDELRSSIRTALMQARRSADIQRQGIESQYRVYSSRVSSTPEQERVLTQIGRQQEVKSGLYLMMLEKREENAISLAATADKGKLIDTPAFEGQVSPKRSIIILIALIIGLGLPLLIIWLAEQMRYKIEGHEDVVRLTNLPIVADVAVASESAKTSAGIVVHENKNNQTDEIFRSMRTNIQFMLQGDQKVIMFTSTTAGEGKTFNAANLAVSFALLGKKVILVGLDIRKPALGHLFGVPDKQQGITPLLAKEKVTEEGVRAQINASGVNANLDLLLAGPIPPNPTELLARENLKLVTDILRQNYDYIIFDTAPVGLVTDTLQIGQVADVCCFVCRADYTPKASFGLVNSLASENKLPNLCIVLNGVDMSKKKYSYYYGYGKYGRYGRYGYGRYGRYGYGRYGGYYGSTYGSYGNYGNYANSHYGDKNDTTIKK